MVGEGEGGGRTHSLLALVVRPSTMDLSRQSPVLTFQKRHLKHFGAHYVSSIRHTKLFTYNIPVPFRRLWRPSKSSFDHRFLPL